MMSAASKKLLIQDDQRDRKLVGIRGWLLIPAIGFAVGPLLDVIYILFELASLEDMLIFPAIGIVLGPFLGIFYFHFDLKLFVDMIETDYGTLAAIVLFLRTVILIYIFVAAWRFFNKYKNAPQTFVYLMIVQLIVSIAGFMLLFYYVGGSLGAFLVMLELNVITRGIAAAIWIPYFKMSKRVKATFIIEEDLPYKIALPIRYLIRKRISWLACSAVALCVFIVVVVMTVMTGLVNDFEQKNHRFVGDCVVGTESLVGFAYYEDFLKILQQQDYVEAVSPVIKSFALVRIRGSRQDFGLEIMGIDPNEFSKTTGFGESLHENKKEVSRTFEVADEPNLPGCVLGDLLAQEIENKYIGWASFPRKSFSISCFPLTAKGALAQAGTDLVNTKTFYVTDRSSSGLPRIDGAIIYLPFEQVQMLCGMAGPTKRVSWIYIKFKQDVKIPAGCEKIRTLWQKYNKEMADQSQAYLLDTVSVQSWREFRRESIAPMENEQTELIIMFGFVAITTVFIILVVFYMIISHKSKDIGILKSVGVSDSGILELFGGFAFLVGLLGSGVGLFTGWLFLLNINRIENWLFEKCNFQLWDRTIFAIGDIPNQLEVSVLLVIGLSAIFVCLIGAFVPSWQAARRKPAETLQVNQL
jgi:lipoprotein-releasing system permease protein